MFNLFCFALLVDEWWRRWPVDGGRHSLVVGIDTAVGAAKVILYYFILLDKTNYRASNVRKLKINGLLKLL